MSERNYWQYVNDIVIIGQDKGQPKHELREEIVSRIHAADAAGEPWAAETLTRWEREGADGDYTKVVKNLNGLTYIRHDGKRVRKTAAYSRTVRAGDSGEIIGQQMQAFWDMSRAELYELRADIADQAERMADVVKIIDRVIEAMELHPECETAAHAWRAEGHSLAEVDLGEATA